MTVLLFCSTVTSQKISGYLTGGYTFTHAPLRDINEFIGLYNENPNKLGGYVFTHGFEELNGLRGVYFGGGLSYGNSILFELNYTRKFNHTFAYYDPANNPTYFRVDIGFGISTVEAAVLFPSYYGKLCITPGIGMGFLSRKMYYWDDETLMIEPKRKDMYVEVKSGSFSLDPMLQFSYLPFDNIPVEFLARVYYQAMFSRMSVGWLSSFEGYWLSTEADSKKVTGGNLGIVFGVKLNIGGLKRSKPDKYRPDLDIVAPDKKPFVLEGRVSDAENGFPINAVVTMYEGSNPVESVVTKIGGFTLKPNFGVKYTIEAKAFGYQTKTENVSFASSAPNPYPYNVKLEKIETGQAIVLENILFEKASAVLLPESFPELNKLLEFLQSAPDVKIEIAGHTSSEGDDSYNLKLSQGRAEAVSAYLIDKGIDESRIVAKGYGETKPVATNESEDGRKLNRRVEFKIIE